MEKPRYNTRRVLMKLRRVHNQSHREQLVDWLFLLILYWPVCGIPPDASSIRQPPHWPAQIAPWGQRPQRTRAQNRAKRSNCANIRRLLRTLHGECLSWCRSNCRPWQCGTASRMPYQTTGNGRVHPTLDTDDDHRILERSLQWLGRIMRSCELLYLPNRPNISTPSAANMKNRRKKRSPRFPTCGSACITVSSKARMPLAIFKSLSTARKREKKMKKCHHFWVIFCSIYPGRGYKLQNCTMH